MPDLDLTSTWPRAVGKSVCVCTLYSRCVCVRTYSVVSMECVSVSVQSLLRTGHCQIPRPLHQEVTWSNWLETQGPSQHMCYIQKWKANKWVHSIDMLWLCQTERGRGGWLLCNRQHSLKNMPKGFKVPNPLILSFLSFSTYSSFFLHPSTWLRFKCECLGHQDPSKTLPVYGGPPGTVLPIAGCGNPFGMQPHSQMNDHISLPNANTPKSGERGTDYSLGLLTSQRDSWHLIFRSEEHTSELQSR